MKTHDKILLAGEILVAAAKECRDATDDVGFAKSILLAGSVSLIITPWLQEKGIESLHEHLAKRAAEFGGTDLSKLSEKELKNVVGKGLGYYRFAYNSLKHTGKGTTVKPSDDLTFEANLKEEAYLLIDAVITDYNKLPLTQEIINTKLSDELLTLLQSPWNFPALNAEEKIRNFI